MSMKLRKKIQVAMAILGLLTGCMAHKNGPKADQLLGTWKTETVQTEWGPATLQITFQTGFELEFKLIPSTNAQQSVVSKGPYQLNGSELASEVFNKGKPVSIWFEGKQLVIQVPNESPRHFSRQ
jgi:hypothetical protein